jgi:hypothetical protein
MSTRAALCLIGSWLLLSACQPSQPSCPPRGTPQFLSAPPPTAASAGAQAPSRISIGGREITVDQVVEGPLCNGAWSGTIYVGCDVQVLAWEGQPDFLKECDLSIAPDTVVYVAYHNDMAYYNGCSCHTAEGEQPQTNLR